MNKLMKKGKSGFTLVELIIVIAILAIVAAIAIPTAANVIGNANTAADNSNAQAIEMAIKTCQSEYSAYSTNGSKNIDNLFTVDATTKALTQRSNNKVTDLLSTYSVSAATLTSLRQSGFHYFYDPTSGKVVAASTKPTGQTQLSDVATCVFSFDTKGVISIHE